MQCSPTSVGLTQARPNQFFEKLFYGKITRSLSMWNWNEHEIYWKRTAVAISLMPSPSPHVRERGSGVLNNFSCHSSPIRELESDRRTSLSTRSSMPAVQCTCMGNALITFFTSFDPTPCDKKCRSEHQTLFPLFRGGVWGQPDYVAITYQLFSCPVKDTVILIAFSHHEVLEEFSQVIVVGCLKEV